LLGELFANAVQHTADAPTDRLIEVSFALTGDHRLRLEVHDAGTGRPSLHTPTPDDEHGRGVLLVNELAEKWGCCPRAGGVGKFVWALCALKAPGCIPGSAGRNSEDIPGSDGLPGVERRRGP
ncbi:ATP-binding protein, partial [Kitasatospora sp. NPDC058243]|uniref:ATP-binding protein n=1 Tax=Kitasatospora sp. NPDC058243 TaxID=3346397 RepID=UPI0036D942C8